MRMRAQPPRYRAYGSTSIEAGSDDGGMAVRVEVGPIERRRRETFLFDLLLSPRPSELVVVTLPRPLGVVFREERRPARAVVADVVPRSRAGRLAALARFDRQQRAHAVLPGDVLRAVTCTCIVWPVKSLLFGMKPPERHVMLFGADRQRWERVANALKQGDSADGPVTLVLEREMT